MTVRSSMLERAAAGMSVAALVFGLGVCGMAPRDAHAQGQSRPGSQAESQALQVLRVTPNDSASAGSVVLVAFDRPVAGMLGASVDVTKIVRITPTVPGDLSWRDPGTIQFVPANPLAPGDSLHIEIDTTFTAMDGTRLARPFRFDVRVPAPKVLKVMQAAIDPAAHYPVTIFRVVLSGALDSATLARFVDGSRITGSAPCVGSGRLHLRSNGPIPKNADWNILSARAVPNDSTGDAYRRLLELEPDLVIPDDCHGDWSMPSLDPRAPADTNRFRFDTRARFALVAGCPWRDFVPQVVVGFTAPVDSAAVAQSITIAPTVAVKVARSRANYSGSTTYMNEWMLTGDFQPGVTYTVAVSANLKDVHGRTIARPSGACTMPHRLPTIAYEHGLLSIPHGAIALPIKYANAETALVVVKPVRGADRARALTGVVDSAWFTHLPDSVVQRVPLAGAFDEAHSLALPLPVAGGPGDMVAAMIRVASPLLKVVTRQSGRSTITTREPGDWNKYREPTPVVLIQPTDLVVHAKVADEKSVVFITSARTGRGMAGVRVALRDSLNRAVGTGVTGKDGTATLRHAPTRNRSILDFYRRPVPGLFVEAALRDDHAATRVDAPWDSPLAERRFPISPVPLSPTATVFTERAIYRPGEMIYLQSIVRNGPLGELEYAKHERLRVVVIRNNYAEPETVYVAERRTSEFGTMVDSVRLSETAVVGPYQVHVSIRRGDAWRSVAQSYFVVREYRAPEFSVQATIDTGLTRVGDTVHVAVNANYYFGAPMAGAAVTWTVTGRPTGAGAFKIPHADGFVSGGALQEDVTGGRAMAPLHGVDTVGANGLLQLAFVPRVDSLGTMAQITVSLAVTDANRQMVTQAVGKTIAVGSFFLGTRDFKREYVWRPGVTDSIALIAARLDGERIVGLPVDVALLYRHWDTQLSKMVLDTVERRAVVTQAAPVMVHFTPARPGEYQVEFTTHDEYGRRVMASRYEYTLQPTPPREGVQLAVVGPKDSLAIGDTVTVAYVNPFENAEAWITVEREQVMEQRRMIVPAGEQHVRIPIRESFTPQVYVAVMLVNHRSVYSTDSLPPLVRTGFTSLTVQRGVRKLDVAIRPRARELTPGDTAIVDLELRDHGKPVRGEATVWGTDEGVLALTAFPNPSPLDAIYGTRSMGSIMATSLRPHVAGLPTASAWGLGRGAFAASLSNVIVTVDQGGSVRVRTDFRPTAFYLGHVVTDANGRATVRAKVPDNLTTFRLIAVATTADRFGGTSDTLLVTRPVVARAALPRFVRPGDSVLAGATVNIRSGVPQPATLAVTAHGVVLHSPDSVVVNAGAAAAEHRWSFTVPAKDTTSRLGFTFRALAHDGQDAVDARVPIKPAGVPRTHTIAGVSRGTSDIEFVLPNDMDLTRSHITLERASSPLGALRWASSALRVYPYDHSEVLASKGAAMIAVYRAHADLDTGDVNALFGNREPREAMRALVIELARRQSDGGAILYWPGLPFTSPWLNAHVGRFLLDARDVGVEVEPRVLNGIAKYLEATLARKSVEGDTTYGTRATRRIGIQYRLSERVAAIEFLSRYGRPALAEEDRVIPWLDRMAWEDRVLFAQAIGDRRPPLALSLLHDAWNSVASAGKRIDLPDSTNGIGDYPSHVRPAARLLAATLALEPGHPMLGQLMETILQLGRAERSWAWNTQDYSSAIVAAAQFSRGQQRTAAKGVSVYASADRQHRTPVLVAPDRETRTSLQGLIKPCEKSDGCANAARLPLTVVGGDTAAPLYFAVTVTEVPSGQSPGADDRGIFVERWYERYTDGAPATSIEEGELVHVRLRITVPSDRQFVVVDDALPAGLEAVDQSLRTSATLGPFASTPAPNATRGQSVDDRAFGYPWAYGTWDSGWWTPWEHREMYDDHVLYFARMLWKGRYEMSYVARATTAGMFVDPPARGEEMYNPALGGRSVGTTFTVRSRAP